MARFRPVSKFRTYTVQALCAYAKGVTLALTGNLTFPTPPVSLVAQGAMNDALEAAILAWGPVGNRGSKAQHQTMMDARAAVEEMIRDLNDYVDGIAAGNAGMIYSAGMVANAVRTPVIGLPAPANLRSVPNKLTVSGQTRLRWGKVKNAVSYNVYTAATPTDPFVLVATVANTLYVGTGAPGRLGYYTIRAVGHFNGLGVETAPLAAYSAF